MTLESCPHDLLVAHRQRKLSSGDARRAEAHLLACLDCRLSEVAHVACLSEISAQAGDDRLVQRMAQRTMPALQKASARQRRSRQVWLCAAPFLLMSAYAAAARLHWLPGLEKQRDQSSEPLPAVSAFPVRTPPTPPEPPVSSSVPGEHASVAGELTAAPRPKNEPSRTPPAAPLGEPPEGAISPAQLFRRAAALRRDGDLSSAMAAYRELERRYPRAEQTALAHIALGRLLLDHEDRPAMALSEFNLYRFQLPQGPLADEARMGRAEALERLGRREEARAAWRELLARGSSSMYGAHAEDRIRRLDAGP